MSLGRLIRQDVDAALRQRGLSLRHLSALGHLSREPGLSYSELGRRAGVTAQSMQATIRQLDKLGAIDQHTVPGRGRTAQLLLTPTGHNLLQDGQQVIREADHQLLSTVPADQQQQLTTTLLRAFTATINNGRPSRPTPH